MLAVVVTERPSGKSRMMNVLCTALRKGNMYSFIRPLILACVLACGASSSLAQAQSRPADDIPNRKELQQAWQAFADKPKEESLRKPLLAKPGDSLQVLVDMLAGRFPADIDQAKVDSLIKALGDESWKVREDATKKLKALGPGILPKLALHAQDKDTEVVGRVRLLMNWCGGESRNRLQSAGGAMLQSELSLQDILPVARKNFLALIGDPEVCDDWNNRPGGLLLASLRYSPDGRDRDLLALYKRAAQNTPARAMADCLMSQGLPAIPAGKHSDFWEKLPKHDYENAVDRILDDQRDGAIFLKALSVVDHNQRVLDHLKSIRPKMTDKTLAQQVDKFIEEQKAGIERRAKIANALASKDDKQFAQGLKDFAAEAGTAQVAELADCLSDVFKKKDRLRAVLAATKDLKDDAALSAGRFLMVMSAKTDADIFSAASDALFALDAAYGKTKGESALFKHLAQICDDLEQANGMMGVLTEEMQRQDGRRNVILQKYKAASKEYGANSAEAKAAIEEYNNTALGPIRGNFHILRLMFQTRANQLRQGANPNTTPQPGIQIIQRE